MGYVTSTDEQRRKIDVRDPIAAELASIAQTTGPVANRLAPALLDVSSVFGALGTDPRVRMAVTDALARLYALGARQAVQA
jgi:fructuronate reductase